MDKFSQFVIDSIFEVFNANKQLESSFYISLLVCEKQYLYENSV